MNLIVVDAIRGRCASFTVLTATVSEIFGGQTIQSILEEEDDSIFSCHFKFMGMQCNVYVYKIREIQTYFTRDFCRYFRFDLKIVGMGLCKKSSKCDSYHV